MEMAWNMLSSSELDRWPDSFKIGDDRNGARELFDAMPTRDSEEWRPPNRALEVTIHKVRYPISESILHQVFCPFGVVEQVHVIEGSTHVEARVVFQSKHAAAEAFGSLHRRNIYDGCCQLIIQYALRQEVAVAVGDRSTETTSPSMMLQGSCVPTTCQEAVTDLVLSTVLPLAMDSTTSDMDFDMSSNCSMKCELSSMDVPVPTNIPEVAPTLSSMSTTLGVPTLKVVMLSSTSLVHANLGADQLFEEMLPDSNTFSYCGIGLDMPVKSPCKYLLNGYNINSYELLEECVPVNIHGKSTVVMWSLLMKWAEQQPWPPPTQRELAFGDADLRPMPWPSFGCNHFGVPCRCAKSDHIRVCRWDMIAGVIKLKPPWSLPTQQFFTIMQAEMLQSLKCMILSAILLISIRMRTELDSECYMHMMFSQADSTQCTCKCSILPRGLSWFLYWTYRATRFFGGVTNSAVLLLYHTIMFPLEKLADGFLSSRNEVQSFCDADGLGFTFSLSCEGSGSVNTMYRLACKLLRLSHPDLSIQAMLISIEENRSSGDIILSFCLQLSRIIWAPRALEHMLFFNNFQALKVCYMEAFHNGWQISDPHFKPKNSRKRFPIFGLFLLSLKKITESSSFTYVQFRYSDCIEGVCTQNTVMVKITATFTRYGAACCVLLNYQERPIPSLGFHYYIVNTVSVAEPTLIGISALVFKFSPQELITRKGRLQVDVPLAISEYNYLLIVIASLKRAAIFFTQTPWDPVGALLHLSSHMPLLHDHVLAAWLLVQISTNNVLLITVIRTCCCSQMTHHLPWDPGGSELIVIIMQWQSDVQERINLSVIDQAKGQPKQRRKQLTRAKEPKWFNFSKRLGGKPLFKKGGCQ